MSRLYRRLLLSTVLGGLATFSGGSAQDLPPGNPGRLPDRLPAAKPVPAILTAMPSALPPMASATATANPAVRSLTIGECIQTAMVRQPTLRGLRASLQGAEANRASIERKIPLESILAKDLPFRRLQADQGILAARAELQQTEQDILYAVVRTYYSSVYARVQSRVAKDIVDAIGIRIKFARTIVDAGDATPEVNETTIRLLTLYRVRAVTKLIEAEEGIPRALDALKEVMALGRNEDLTIADTVLPGISVDFTRDTIIDQALCRRGEIFLAAAGLDVLRLEELAQGSIKFQLKVPTAAQAADIHTRSIPQGTRDGEYRPDAFGPELPSLLVGNREARVFRAMLLTQRADAVSEKTRNLVTLEAENAFSRWTEASRKLVELKVAAEAGKALTKSLADLVEGRKRDLTQEITAEGLASEAQASFNESIFNQIMSLGAIERITAGGIRVNYPGR